MKRSQLTGKQIKELRASAIKEMEVRNFDSWFQNKVHAWDGASSELPQAVRRLLDQVAADMELRINWRKPKPKQEPLTEEMPQETSTPTQPTTPEQQVDSEPEHAPASDQSGQENNPPQSTVEEQEQQEQQHRDIAQTTQNAQDETRTTDRRDSQTSQETVEQNTQQQQQAQPQIQSDSQQTQQQQSQQQQPFFNGGVPVQPAQSIKSGPLAHEVISKTESLRCGDVQSITGNDNSGFQAITGDSVTANQGIGYPEDFLQILANPDVSDKDKQDIHTFAESSLLAIMAKAPPRSNLDDIPDRKYSIDGILPDRGICFINGQPKTTKTFLGASLAHAISRGDSFAGRQTQKRPVIFIELEGMEELEIRLGAITKFHNGAVFEDLMIYDELIYPGTREGNANLRILLNRLKTQGRGQPVVILDNLSLMINGDENKASDVKDFNNNINSLKNDFDALVLIISHSGKDDDKGISGSNKFHGIADLVLTTKPHDDGAYGHFVVVPSRVRTGKPPTMAYTLKEVVVREATDKRPARTEVIIDYNDIAIIDDYIDIPVVDGKVKASTVGISYRLIIGAIDALEAQGKVAREHAIKEQMKINLGGKMNNSVTGKYSRAVDKIAEAKAAGILREDERGAYSVNREIALKWNK